MTRNKWIGLVVVVVIILGGIIYFATMNSGGDLDEDMISIEATFEEAGVTMEWDEASRTLYLGVNKELEFTLDSTTMVYDGIPYEMEKPVVMAKDEAYVDGKLLRDLFGATIEDGVAVLPDYATRALKESFKTKKELYQQAVETEKEFLEALNPQTGWDVARELVKIGSSDIGFRLGGTPEAKMAADVIYAKYEELGLMPKYHTFETYGWRYLDSSFTVEGADLDIPVVSVVGTKATPEEGITAELVYVGTATKQEMADIDVQGKIAVIKMDLDYHPWQSQGAYAVANQGAVGVIYYCENYYAQYEGGEAFNAQDWSGSEIDIPVLNTPKKYGEQLVAAMEGAKLKATLVSEVEIDEKAPGYNVIGMIEGAKYPDEYVIVNAHTDAHFYGFQDDSIAIGGIVAIAEAMQKSDYTPDRTILFLSMDAEEFGAIDLGPDWLLGSWNLMKEKNTEWAGNVVGSLTIELFAYEGTENFELRASDTLHEYIINAARGFEYSAYKGLGVVKNEISNMSDEFSMAYFGIPTFRTNTDPFVVENIYHTQFDIEETTSFDKYAEALSHYAKLFIRLDKMAVAPYDLTLGIRKYDESMNYEAISGLEIGDELQGLAGDYKAKATELYFKNALILKLYDQAKMSGKNVDLLKSALVDYNKKVRETVRLYLTGTLAMAGETVALEIPFYQDLPALFDAAIAAFNEGDGAAASELLSGLKGSYYADFEDYDTWYSINRDNINPRNPDRDILWTEEIRLQFFDHYKMTQGLKEKLASGDESLDFSYEIETCEKFKQQAIENLREGYNKNVSMFNKVNPQFPLAEADRLIQDIEAL
ncbi:MAG: M28 family peptidase [Anaerovoracaceae bacterium]|jgi:Iap family predicted aminopeptidase|nr:M28 family peptidase [Anaerovoracaceae bacterium]